MSAALPLLVLAIEWRLRRSTTRAGAGALPVRRAGFAPLVPYAAVWLALFLTTRLPTAKLPLGVAGFRETAEIPRFAYLLTQLTVVPRYLALALWPRGQSLDPEAAIHAAPDARVLVGLGVLLAAGAAAAWSARRRPLVLAGWLWCLIALLPESSLIPIRDVMVEHRMYLPLAGLAWIAAALLADLPGRRAWRVAVPAALVLALTGATQVRNRVWRNEVTLWSDVIVRAPNLARGHNNLAMALEQGGEVARAEAEYRRALALDGDYLYGLVNLGRLYGIEGRYREGLELLQHAESLAPEAPDVLNNLGLTWLALGDSARAADAWLRAAAAAPGAVEPALNLARLRALESRAGPASP
jgi:tetratricopeptide (TPR) repeat protein